MTSSSSLPVLENNSSSHVIHYVISEIISKHYDIGDRLPTERELAEQFQVSRATVREALKALSYLGFVSSTQGSGNYVTDDYEKTVAYIMYVMYSRGDISFDDFTEFRIMLEIHSFELAINNASNEQKIRMADLAAFMDTCEEPNEIIEADKQFHTILAEASGNKLIIMNYYAWSSVLSSYMHETYHKRVSVRQNGFKALQKYHHEIINALILKNPAAGIKAIRNHFALLRNQELTE